MAYTTSRSIFVFSVLVAAACGCGQAAEPLVRPKITISKETTYVLGPVRPDGYVDYAAAINDLCGRGVTPEDNAAVPIWQAIGPAELPKGVRDRFFKLLGIAGLPDKGDYLVDFTDYVERVRGQAALNPEGLDEEQWEERCDEQFDKAEKAPWSQEQYPLIAGWLKANEKPLQVIVEGVRRPRFYSPVFSDDDDSLISVLIPHLTASREAARLLTIRAMLRLQSGQVQKAWDDVLACHRLARLVGQGPFLIDLLIGTALEGIAHEGDVALAHDGRLSADQARRFQADLWGLPPLPKAVDTLATGERLFGLACLSQMARVGVKDEDMEYMFILREDGDYDYDAVKKLAADRRVDWDAILRTANDLLDQVIQAHRQPTRSQRKQALERLTSKLEAAGRQARDRKALSKALADDAPPEAVTRHLSGILFDDAILSAYPEDLAATRMSLSRLALALAGSRSDHGRYPKNLSELAPEYISKIPKDLFADGEFRYQRRGQGYLLYSVGFNQTDEAGRSCRETVGADEDDDPESTADDIGVRTPTDAR